VPSWPVPSQHRGLRDAEIRFKETESYAPGIAAALVRTNHEQGSPVPTGAREEGGKQCRPLPAHRNRARLPMAMPNHSNLSPEGRGPGTINYQAGSTNITPNWRPSFQIIENNWESREAARRAVTVASPPGGAARHSSAKTALCCVAKIQALGVPAEMT
jgi:hypothetical protein